MAPRKTLLQGTLDLLILKALSTGELHGLGVSRRIEQIVNAEKKLNANVDFYSASLYHLLGIPRQLFTPIFAVSRVAGWTAHVLEQYAHNRLIRPRAEYIGPNKSTYVPIDQRQNGPDLVGSTSR